MTEESTSKAAGPEVRRTLATLDATRERVYYDATADASVRAGYYATIDESEAPEQLFHSLGVLLEHTHAPRPAYKPTERVYPWVDLHPDGRLRSIYSDKPFDAEEFIRADAEIARQRSARLQELARRESTRGPREFEVALTRSSASCRSTVSTSCRNRGFQSASRCAATCTIYSRVSLAATRSAATPRIFDFPVAQERVMSDCGRSEAPGFEPVAGTGPVARATLYFLLRYPGHVGDEARELQRERVSLLLDWHRANSVEEYERHRNAAIAELQGNRKPADRPSGVG